MINVACTSPLPNSPFLKNGSKVFTPICRESRSVIVPSKPKPTSMRYLLSFGAIKINKPLSISFLPIPAFSNNSTAYVSISKFSNEFTVNALLRMSDLNILPWISSTFFEALYFNADIFVIEEDVFEKAFEQKLKNEIFYYENVDKFKLNLERYLEEGQFYKYKKDLSKSYLLNLDNFNRRDKVLNEVLDNFSKN